jgi:methionine-gamma-lyase
MDNNRFDPSNAVQDFLVFGGFGDVNPSITDSSTFTFMSPDRMAELDEKGKSNGNRIPTPWCVDKP